MSWLSDFLGMKKLKMPAVKGAEEMAPDDEFSADSYLKELERKNGFMDTIVTGGKKPKLASPSLL